MQQSLFVGGWGGANAVGGAKNAARPLPLSAVHGGVDDCVEGEDVEAAVEEVKRETEGKVQDYNSDSGALSK